MALAIPAAATAFGNWVSAAVFASIPGSVSIGTAATIANIAYMAAYSTAYVGLNAAVMLGLNAVARSQLPQPEEGQITRKQARPLRWYAVGGPSRMSGAYMLREASGNKLAVVLALCEGRLSSIDRIYLNDDLITLSGGYVQGLANERYGTGDLIRLDTRLGLPTETHYGFLTADFGTYWPTNARGDGVASLAFLAQHRSRESFARHYPNGEPIPSVVGAPVCYDWRDETQDREVEATWKASANPVVWLVHQEWARFGRSWARCIEPVLDDLTAEADYCDVLVSKGEGEGTEPRYTVAGNYPANTEPATIRANILAAMDGWLSVNGKGHLIVRAGRYDAPTFTIPAEHIDGYTWQAFRTAEEAINDLTVSFTSPEHDYNEVEAGLIESPNPHPMGKSDDLPLRWVTSQTQALRLGARKMTRDAAPRRGTIRTGIYGLNGIGERFIRIQNPELSSMADVVVEVMDVEIDLERAQVVFDVIQADQNIDDEPLPPVVPVPDTPRPPPTQPRTDPPVRPLGRDVDFPIDGDADTISIGAFNGFMESGETVSFPADTVTGLDNSTVYGVFYHPDDGYEVEAFPATSHMESGGWIFLGWQATSDGGGNFPAAPSPPSGFGGAGETWQPLLPTSFDDLTDVPDELTDGRIAAALAPDGSLQPGAVVQMGPAAAPVTAQPFLLTGDDGETVYYPYELPGPPMLALALNSRLKQPTRTGEYLDLAPEAVTGSSLKLRAKLVYPGSAPDYDTQVDDDLTGATLTGADAQWHKETDDAAWNRVYVASVDVICDGDPDPSDPLARQAGYAMTLRFLGRRGASDGWTLLGSTTVVSVATGGIGQPANDTPQTVTIAGEAPGDWTSWTRHGATEYRVSVYSGHDVDYRKIDAINSVTFDFLVTPGSGAETISALEPGEKLSLIAIPDLS